MQHIVFGRTGLRVPPLAFGTTSLGNLFRAPTDAEKRAIVESWFEHVPRPILIDSAGKYGAGMALEVLGRELTRLGVEPGDVFISNKLGWRRTPLTGPKPTFEPDAWIDIEYDAVQDISADGILRCWEEGCELLGPYRPAFASVHDPDEYLDAATDAVDRRRRLDDIVEAYRTLDELKRAGVVKAIGIGAKRWQTIRELDAYSDFDWVMFANSLTIMNHPPDLLDFIESLAARGVGIMNSALFHGGFLVGGDFFDYRPLDPDSAADRERLAWRERFWGVCDTFGVRPFDVGVAFGRSVPGVAVIALSSSRSERTAEHVAAIDGTLPSDFWQAMRQQNLIDPAFPYV